MSGAKKRVINILNITLKITVAILLIPYFNIILNVAFDLGRIIGSISQMIK